MLKVYKISSITFIKYEELLSSIGTYLPTKKEAQTSEDKGSPTDTLNGTFILLYTNCFKFCKFHFSTKS